MFTCKVIFNHQGKSTALRTHPRRANQRSKLPSRAI
nr:MAG TPA: hypothetical protein [Caudoviricetes sp.]